MQIAVKQCLARTAAIVGDLATPRTGSFISWTVDLSKGVADTPLAARSVNSTREEAT